MRDQARYGAMETTSMRATRVADCVDCIDWMNHHVVVHLGASHAMGRLLFQEDAEGHLQNAWTDGRLIILSPELSVVDHLVYRAGLSHMLNLVAQQVERLDDLQVVQEEKKGDAGADVEHSHSHINRHNHNQVVRIKSCDYAALDRDIGTAKHRVDEARTMEEVFAELYRLVTKYVTRGQLDSPCYFDSGWESFHLYKSVSQALARNTSAPDDDSNSTGSMRLPWTRLGLINSRNAAIGDSLHAFYATASESFPLVVCGDTAALPAGGISMINIHTSRRFGVVIIPNNRGMAIEDVISKRSVDGHQYQYEYVKLDQKRDIFTLDQLKEAIKNDVLAALRDHLWGVPAHRAHAVVLHIDVQSMRKENAKKKAPTDAVLVGSSFLDEDFGERFLHLERPRRRLEAIVDALYAEINQSRCCNGDGARSSLPVKIQACSAIEFMEIISQLTITGTMRDKLKFLPTPTDLLATRTLLPSLLEAPSHHQRTISRRPGPAVSNFINSNGTFSVFVSNAAFGLDGLSNLISTHLEYGTGTLVHLAYDAAAIVTHYSLIGQVHHNFGIRPSKLLPSLYRSHQAYEGQIIALDYSADDADNDNNNDEHQQDEHDVVPSCVLRGLRDPHVKVILVDMGAPNLTAALK
jgi:hypothetical protein